MITTVTQIGNSCGLILDEALMDKARLKVGDEVSVTARPGGGVDVLPVRETFPDPAAVEALVRETAADYRRTLSRLA